MAPTAAGVLSGSLLETFRARAAVYDRENRFFQEDFDDLRQAGYLRMAVPRELGGLGYTPGQKGGGGSSAASCQLPAVSCQL